MLNSKVVTSVCWSVIVGARGLEAKITKNMKEEHEQKQTGARSGAGAGAWLEQRSRSMRRSQS